MNTTDTAVGKTRPSLLKELFQEFVREFPVCWRQVPNKGLFFGLLVAWLALFQFLGNATFGYIDTPSLFGWLSVAYNSNDGDDSFGQAVPFLVLGLLWWKRRELLAASARLWWPGLGLVVLGLALHVVGYVVQQPKISTVALFVGVYGLIGTAWGPGWLRACFFPFFLFAFCIPLGSQSQPVTFRLRMLSTKISVMISHVIGIDVIRDGSQIYNTGHTYMYDVAPACSGIRSLISLLVLTIVYSFVCFRRPWKRLVLVASAFPLAVAGNVLRLTMIIFAAEAFGQKAGNFVHENFFFSLLPYVPAIAGWLWLGHWLREPEVKAEPANV
ncbi:MAG TPA: exosortase/archaeosortase family protein [Dongiaceae bacterium]|jgi:exosortase|nr:exosortase/archaeosortase family protein [Dongiaceae bacterium]